MSEDERGRVDLIVRRRGVRLILEDYIGFLWRDVELPFIPFVGLCVRLKSIDDAGWWDEPHIDAVEWVVPSQQFECTAHLSSDITKPIKRKLLAAGWQRL